MKKPQKTLLENLSITDRQLLESIGQEAIHKAKKTKVIHANRELKKQLKTNNG